MAGKVIHVYANGYFIGNATTHNGELVTKVGKWEMPYYPTETGTFSIYAEFTGDADYAGCDEEADFEW